MQISFTPINPPPKPLDQVRERIRVKHYSICTKTQYVLLGRTGQHARSETFEDLNVIFGYK